MTGNSNTVNGSSPKVNGNVNNVRGNYPVVNGDSNTVNGTSPQVNGHGNRVTGNHDTVRGNNNTAHGNSSPANGDHNVISGRYASAIGSSNNVTGEHSRASGVVVRGENAFASTGRNNTVNGVSAEQEHQRQQQGLEQRIQQLQQNRHELELQSLLFHYQALQLHGPLQQRQPQQPAPVPILPQQQPAPPPPLPPRPHQQPIKLALRGDDEPADEDNENGDSCCSLGYVNKAVVASVCCSKLISCLGCTRILYEGKMVGQEKCLNCQRHVDHVVRIS